MGHPQYLIKPIDLFIQFAVVQKFKCLFKMRHLSLTGVFKAESVYRGSSLRLSGRISCEGEL